MLEGLLSGMTEQYSSDSEVDEDDSNAVAHRENVVRPSTAPHSCPEVLRPCRRSRTCFMRRTFSATRSI